MKEYIFNDVNVSLSDGFKETDAAKYFDYVMKNIPPDELNGAKLAEIDVTLCDDGKVDVDYTLQGEKFERIRRITGYLTGDLTSWNNAKRSEERERVKHSTDWFTSSGRAFIED